MSEPGKLAKPPDGCSATGTATAARTTMSPARLPARFSTAAWPGKIPPFGADTTVVKPAPRQVSILLSVRLASSAALLHGVVAGRSSGPPGTPCRARGPSPPAEAGAAGRPTSVKESINPGYTIKPLPSITQASGGIVAFVPTAVISPRVITIVPFSSAGPETG